LVRPGIGWRVWCPLALSVFLGHVVSGLPEWFVFGCWTFRLRFGRRRAFSSCGRVRCWCWRSQARWWGGVRGQRRRCRDSGCAKRLGPPCLLWSVFGWVLRWAGGRCGGSGLSWLCFGSSDFENDRRSVHGLWSAWMIAGRAGVAWFGGRVGWSGWANRVTCMGTAVSGSAFFVVPTRIGGGIEIWPICGVEEWGRVVASRGLCLSGGAIVCWAFGNVRRGCRFRWARRLG